jgi:hypothetical protein
MGAGDLGTLRPGAPVRVLDFKLRLGTGGACRGPSRALGQGVEDKESGGRSVDTDTPGVTAMSPSRRVSSHWSHPAECT